MTPKIRSVTPGRVRLEVADLVGRTDLCGAVEQALAAHADVRAVVANPTTGRVLVVTEPAVTVEALVPHVQRAVADAPALVAHARTELAARPRGGDAMARLLTRAQRHPGLLAGTLTASVIDRLFDIAPSLLISAATDVALRRDSSLLRRLGLASFGSQLVGLGVAGVGIWALRSLTSYLRTFLTLKLTAVLKNDLRNEIYQHLQTLDVGMLEQHQVTRWMTLLGDDVNRIEKFIDDGVDPFISVLATVMTVGSTVLAASPGIAAVQAVLLPGLYLVSTRMLTPIRARQLLARDDEDALTGVLHENISAMSTIAAFDKLDDMAERVAAAGAATLASAEHAARLRAAYVPTIQLMAGLGFITTLVMGAARVEAGQLDPSMLNVMGLTSVRLLNQLGLLGVSIENYRRTAVSMARVFKLLDTTPKIESGDRALPAAKGAFVIEGASFGYDAAAPVFRSLDLELPAGKTIGIVGTTGAGKSTLLKLLLRFYDPQAGRITLDGVDVRELELDALRRAIAFVSQEVVLFTGTIRDNIAFARPDASLDEVIACARIAEADAFIRKLPAGYDTHIGQRGMRLSGGQRQRIAIARALLADRPILLFDEATSSIDNETEAAIQRSLRLATAGRTTVVVAHRLSTVRNADVIYVLDDGRVRERGRHEDLVTQDGVYAGLWRIQTGEAPHN